MAHACGEQSRSGHFATGRSVLTCTCWRQGASEGGDDLTRRRFRRQSNSLTQELRKSPTAFSSQGFVSSRPQAQRMGS
jgi:hypothetical protein